MKTISNIAKELNVSKTAVRRYLTDEIKTQHTETRDGVIYINENGESQIKSKFRNKIVSDFAESSATDTANVADNVSCVSDNVSALIAMLQKQLDEKDKQLAERDKQISDLIQSLQAEQTLHAGTQLKLSAPVAESVPAKVNLWDKLFKRK